jgi:hypothetical protein
MSQALLIAKEAEGQVHQQQQQADGHLEDLMLLALQEEQQRVGIRLVNAAQLAVMHTSMYCGRVIHTWTSKVFYKRTIYDKLSLSRVKLLQLVHREDQVLHWTAPPGDPFQLPCHLC